MNDISPNILSDVREIAKKGNYDGAIAALDKIDKSKIPNPLVNILYSRYIQLSETGQGRELDDVHKLLVEAVETDNESLRPHIELAFFHSAIQDDEVSASKEFLTALNIIKDSLSECIEGILQMDPYRFHETWKDIEALLDTIKGISGNAIEQMDAVHKEKSERHRNGTNEESPPEADAKSE